MNDRIWEYTETRFQEYKSSDLLCSVLEGEGFKVEKDIGGYVYSFYRKLW